MELNASLLHMLHRASQAGDYIFALSIGEADLTARQFAILLAIASNEGGTQSDLVNQTGIDRSTLSDVVHRLQDRGLLSRTRSATDARAYVVKLTDGGVQALHAATLAAERVDQQLLESIGEGKRDELLDLLRLIAARMPKYQTSGKPGKQE
jgi:MarR family transcriptional regulator, temperature-dependent positive regulator of motility